MSSSTPLPEKYWNSCIHINLLGHRDITKCSLHSFLLNRKKNLKRALNAAVYKIYYVVQGLFIVIVGL